MAICSGATVFCRWELGRKGQRKRACRTIRFLGADIYGHEDIGLVERAYGLMRKSIVATICLSFLWPGVAARGYEPLANEGKDGLYARSVEQVLRLRPEEVDLATAVLIVSERWSDLVHGRRHLESLDEMALEIRRRLKEKKLKPNYRAIEIINEYLFGELEFKPLEEADDPNDLFLHTVLDKKKGYCLSLSVLYLSLAERLGLPLYGVVVPGHFFVRYDDGRMRFNIETTSRGGTASDAHYVKKFKVPEGNRDSIYMKNLNSIHTLGCFFNNLGNSYSDVGNMESALLALLRAVEINPMLSESRANLGNVYLKMGRLVEATREYEAALAINPSDPKTHNNLGNAYSERGWMGYAISAYRRSLELDPEFVDAHRNLAIAYTKQERYSLAVQQLKIAIELKPTDADGYGHLGDVYTQMSEYQRAMIQYKNALKYKPNLAEAHYGLGVCYGHLGRVEDERKAYEGALAANPYMLNALVNLGNVYFGQKKFDVAIELYARAAEVQPTEGMIFYNLGAAYSNKGDYERAVDAYSKAVEIDNSIGDAHYGLAFGYYQLKLYELAWKHIQIAEKLGVKVSEDQANAIKRHLK